MAALNNKGRCVIVAAGESGGPGLLRRLILDTDFVIAADAGYLKCNGAGISPELIVGDFDSAARPRTAIPVLALEPVKNVTDAEAALLEAERRGFWDVLLLGATGGRLDHCYANFVLAAGAKRRGVSLTIEDENHRVRALKDESVCLKKGEYRYFSVFAFGGDCLVSESGVFYPLVDYRLSPYSALGVSNEITAEFAEITVKEGMALLIESERLGYDPLSSDPKTGGQ